MRDKQTNKQTGNNRDTSNRKGLNKMPQNIFFLMHLGS